MTIHPLLVLMYTVYIDRIEEEKTNCHGVSIQDTKSVHGQQK